MRRETKTQAVHVTHRSTRIYSRVWCFFRVAPLTSGLAPPAGRTCNNTILTYFMIVIYRDKRDQIKNVPLLGPLASCESCTPAAVLGADLPSCTLMHNAFDPPPVAENSSVSIRRQGCSAEADRPGARKNSAPATRGVAEHVLAASGALLHAHLDPQNPAKPVSSRPSSTDAPARAAWRDGKELGEHTLLDMDCVALAEAEGGGLERTGRLVLQTDLPPLVESPTDEELQGKNQDLPQQDVAGHRLLGGKSLPFI